MHQSEQRQTEQRLIEALFDKLRQAEHQSGPRDPDAERQIATAVERQSAAPYYMAQVILVQERALETLSQRVQALEYELAGRPAASGGFLDGLLGVPKAPAAGTPGSAAPSSQPERTDLSLGRGGFMASALQTAFVVAGGVVLANLLTELFSSDEAQAASEPAPDAGLEAQFDDRLMDDGDMGDFDGFDDF